MADDGLLALIEIILLQLQKDVDYIKGVMTIKVNKNLLIDISMKALNGTYLDSYSNHQYSYIFTISIFGPYLERTFTLAGSMPYLLLRGSLNSVAPGPIG